ncbi:AraC family transcriptional regulator [Pedobacter sp. P351]|uniref:AraC family transcriptional regulator n=1 Tax=Pedobacter superstes TaxID=3133441 RepID=UPI0030A37C95
MRPRYRKVPVKLEKSFNIRRDVKPHFVGVGHYHPELELHYVVKGEGVRFIGNTTSQFSDGEIVLIGENLPHAWRSSDLYYQNNPAFEIDAIVINFVPEFLGKEFLHLPETLSIMKLFDRARMGLVFHGQTQNKLSELILSALNTCGFDRIVILLQILNLMAHTTDCRTIVNGSNMLFQRNEYDAKRLNKICEHALSNYMREIHLEEVADLCNLSITSFCRYFKTMTTKTYVDFLNEIRVSQACKLLVDDRLPAEIICFDCGFHNISNFYRHFKKVVGKTPQEYRKQYFNSLANL